MAQTQTPFTMSFRKCDLWDGHVCEAAHMAFFSKVVTVQLGMMISLPEMRNLFSLCIQCCYHQPKKRAFVRVSSTRPCIVSVPKETSSRKTAPSDHHFLETPKSSSCCVVVHRTGDLHDPCIHSLSNSRPFSTHYRLHFYYFFQLQKQKLKCSLWKTSDRVGS